MNKIGWFDSNDNFGPFVAKSGNLIVSETRRLMIRMSMEPNQLNSENRWERYFY